MSLRRNHYYGRSLRDTSMETTNVLLLVVCIELAALLLIIVTVKI